ncbi:MAG: putative maltokinase, partial [Chloroflexota bacterium]
RWENLLAQERRDATAEILLQYLRGCRWFGGKAREVRSAEIVDVVPAPYDTSVAQLTLIKVSYAEGEPETYLLPLTFATGEGANLVTERSPYAVVARLRVVGREGEREGVLCDALADQAFCHGLLEAIAHRHPFRTDTSQVTPWPTRALRRILGSSADLLEPSLLRGEQSNTSVLFADRLILKVFRRVEEGVNPDLEIGRFLTEKASFPNVPPLAGAMEYRPSRRAQASTVGILHGYVPNQGDAWRYTQDSLGRYFDRVLAHPEVGAPPIHEGSLLALSQEDLPTVAQETLGPYLASAELLGKRTAQLHMALASDSSDPNFAPEPFSALYQRSLFQSMRSSTIQGWQLLRQRLPALPEAVREDAQNVLGMQGAIIGRFLTFRQRRINAMRIRCHGDYHLGQVLYTGADFVVIDFEGEPARPLSERRLKRSPLRDVAGMIRSFHYASQAALSSQGPMHIRPEDLPYLDYWAQLWYLWISATFLRSYLAVMSETDLLPTDLEDLSVMLDAYLLDKAVYEVGYELNNRPDWIGVPLRGILRLLEEET